jgi:ribosome modulation factor
MSRRYKSSRAYQQGFGDGRAGFDSSPPPWALDPRRRSNYENGYREGAEMYAEDCRIAAQREEDTPFALMRQRILSSEFLPVEEKELLLDILRLIMETSHAP